MQPSLTVLDESLINHILAEEKQILSEIGMEICGPMLRQRLLLNGLEKDENSRIRFPPHIVDQAIATALSTFTLYDREGEPNAELGKNNVHFVREIEPTDDFPTVALARELLKEQQVYQSSHLN